MFPTTRWTLVLRAGGDEADTGRERALGELFEAYWRPLYRFARRTGASDDDARDRIQELFATLLERGDLGSVRADRGRFRSWLLAAFRHHVAAVRERAGAMKRGGGRAIVSLDAAEPGTLDAPDPGDDPEAAYIRDWAVTVLARVVDRLDAEYREKGRAERFRELKPYLVGEDGTGYAEIGARLGMSEGAVKVAVHRLRGRYRELLRREVEDTVADADDVDDELRRLAEALAGYL